MSVYKRVSVCVLCLSLYNHRPLLGEHTTLGKPMDTLEGTSHYAYGFSSPAESSVVLLPYKLIKLGF